jgi:hypothetical protein
MLTKASRPRQITGDRIFGNSLSEIRTAARANFRVPWLHRSSIELLGEPDEKPFRPPDVAEPIRVQVPDHFAHQLCAALAKPLKGLVDIVHGEHDAEVAQCIYRALR